MLLVSYVECDVPEEMTLHQWRHSRSAGTPSRRHRWRRLAHMIGIARSA